MQKPRTSDSCRATAFCRRFSQPRLSRWSRSGKGLRGPAARKRRSQRRERQFRFEQLEQKLALDAAAFEAGNQVVLVVSGGDDLYVSRTNTEPSSLIYATNGSFLGDETQAGIVRNLDQFANILISEASTTTEPLVESDGLPGWGVVGQTSSTMFIPKNSPHYGDRYPRIGFDVRGDFRDYNVRGGAVTGNFAVGGDVVSARTSAEALLKETRGTIRVTQPDGVESEWRFTNWNQTAVPNAVFDNQNIRIVGGPGYGGGDRIFGQSPPPAEPLPGNYYYPTRIVVEEFANAFTGFRVEWNRSLPLTANPTIVLDSYQSQNQTPHTNEVVRVASNAVEPQTREVEFTLRDAAGRGIVQGAVQGQVYLPAFNATVDFRATPTPAGAGGLRFALEFVNPNRTVSSSYVFDPVSNPGSFDIRQLNQATPGRAQPISVSGTYDPSIGTIQLQFQSSTGVGNLSGRAAVGEVQLRNVKYAVFDQNLDAATKSKVTVSAGLTLTQGLTIDMLTPGASVAVNSPVNTTGIPGGSPDTWGLVEQGAIALRATNVTLNADVSAQSRIDIGYTTERALGNSAIDNVPTSEALGIQRPALLIPQFDNQAISAIVPVLGHEGAGYINPPKVVVARPQATSASVSVGSFLGGLTEVRLTNAGTGYEGTKISLIIAKPDSEGLDDDGDLSNGIKYPSRQAAGYAEIAGGKVTSVTITDGGFGYTTPPSVALPAPTAPPQKNAQGGEIPNIPATVATAFGGIITRLQIDNPGYNYEKQTPVTFDSTNSGNTKAEYAVLPSNPSFESYNKAPGQKGFVFIQGFASTSRTGDPAFTAVVNPLIGDRREFARLDLPPTGISGSFFENGVYPFSATVDAAGRVDYSFDIAVSAPLASVSGAQRPVITATLNAAGRIESYTVVNGGQGYGGTVPSVFVTPPIASRPAGAIEAVVVTENEGQVSKLVAKNPDLVFDVARSMSSFVNDDFTTEFPKELFKELYDDRGELIPDKANAVVANLQIPFTEGTVKTPQAGGKIEEIVTRVSLVLQQADTELATDVLEIPYATIADDAYLFGGELVGVASIGLSRLVSDLPQQAGRLNELRSDFGTYYRLVVRTTTTITIIDRDGSRGAPTSVPTNLTIGKAYLATGYGYSAPPIVRVQAASADAPAARFTASLDPDGRVRAFDKEDGGKGYLEGQNPVATVTGVSQRPVVETLSLQSSIRSRVYDVRMGDDPSTSARSLGELYVSPLTTVGNGANAADELFLQMDAGRAYVEGKIWSKEQGYLFQSPGFRELDGPFLLTTLSRNTGRPSGGTLVGETLQIQLGNETTERSATGVIVSHQFDIDSDVDSVRVTAGESRGVGVYPYDITIREQTSVSVDAMVSSSGAIRIDAQKDVSLNAAVETVGDFSLKGGGRVDLFGPIVSQRGVISLEATNVSVNAPVRVVESRRVTNDDGEVEPSVVITASAGDLTISGAITSPDSVALRQRDAVTGLGGSIFKAANVSVDDKGKTTTSTDLNLTIPDRQVVSATVNVPQLVPYERINVELDIAHTWVGDLTATLVSPQGERFVLFSNVGGGSDNLEDVTFDSALGQPIALASPPLRGIYAPRDAVQPRFGVVGTWRLELFDAFFGDSGTLNTFSLQFVTADGSTTTVGSVSGRGLVESPKIVIDADGTIGSVGGSREGLLAVRSSRVEARSVAAAVGLQSDRSVEFVVETPADVALYVGGTDVIGAAGTEVAALRAQIRGASSVAVEAPRGSVDVEIDSAKAVVLRSIEGNGGAAAQAAGFVSITLTGADLAVADAPLGGGNSQAVKTVFDLNGQPGYRLVGDVEGEAAGVLRGSGLLPSGLRSGDRVLVVDSKAPAPVSGTVPQGRDLFKFVPAEGNSSARVEIAGIPVKDASGRVIDPSKYLPWQPVAGGEFNGQCELVWHDGVGNLAVWGLSSANTASPNAWTGSQRVYRRGEQGASELERKYGRDLDGDGGIGFQVIENRGSARLEIRPSAQGDQIFVNGVAVTSSGVPVFNNTQGWIAKAADTIDGVNMIVWQKTINNGVQSVLWQCDANWRRSGSRPVPTDVETLARYESALGEDINGDQIVGKLVRFIDGLRGESVFRGADGVLYVGDQPLKRGGALIRAGQYTGWQVIAARLTDAGKPASVLWKHTSGRLAEWKLDVSGNYIADGQIPSAGSNELRTFQEGYGVNLPSAGFQSLVANSEFTTPAQSVPQLFGNNPAIGVYDVVSVGGVGTEWILVRTDSLNTAAELADRTYVSAADTGTTYRVDRLAGKLGRSDARVVEVAARETSLSVDDGKSVQYVVASNGGSGSVSGSLGRILSLVEANRFDAIAPNVVFGMDVGVIALSQQLPAITKPVVLDGYLRWDAAAARVTEIFPTENNGVAVFGRLDDSGDTVYLPTVTAVALDGSRITLDRSGAPISAFSAESIDGLVFESVVGSGNLATSEARPAGVKNLGVGGFTRGAGITVRQSSNVLLEALETGAAEVSGRRGNRTGIEIAGSTNVTVKDTTINGNSVGLDVSDLYTGDFGDEGVGVSDGVVVVGGVMRDNQVGIRLGSQGRARIGALPIPGKVGLRLQRGTTLVDMRSAEFSSNLTLPEFFARLYVGMPIGGTGVAAGTFVSAFDAVAQEIVLSRPIAASSPAQQRTAVVFGRTSAAERENSVAGAAGASSADGNVISGNTTGVELLDGAHHIVGATIRNNAAAGVWIGGARNVAGTAGHQVGVAGALAGRFENVITGNNGFGVLVRDSAAPLVSIRENMFAVAGSVAGDNVPGNLGVRALQSGIMRNRAFSGLSNEYAPASDTGIDSRGNLHSPADESSVRPPDPPVVNAFIGGVVATTTPLISGTGAPGGIITIYIDGQQLSQTTEVAANGLWSLWPTAPLATGRRSIAATVKNSVGQTSVLSNTVEVDVQPDTTPPDTTGLAITTQQLTSTSPSIAGTAEEIGAILELEIRNNSWSSPATYRTLVGSDGTWRVDTASPLYSGTFGTFVHQGTYAVKVLLIDAVGNRSDAVAKNLMYSNPPPPPEPPRRPTTRF